MQRRTNHQFDPWSEEASSLDTPGFDPGSIDYSDPASFFKAIGQPVPPILSPSEVRVQARQRASSIFDSHSTLRAILDRHEATIQTRWTKKSRAKRLQVLLKAWPAMPASHRPDFEAFRKDSQQQQQHGMSALRSPKYRDCFVWPYVNQEDLALAKPLLLLLNSRGRHPPSSFAGADFDAMHFGLVSRALEPVFLNHHVMILSGVTSMDKYGELLNWDDHEDAFDWMHTRKQYQPGEGLIVLEAQERLMGFLVDCCKEILHDIPEANLVTGESFTVQPEPQLKTDVEAYGFASLALMSQEAPYRLPSNLDFARIVSLLEAKVAAAEDHVWSLREDPAYFAQQLVEVKEHRQEMLPDALGNAHPIFSGSRQNIFWTRVVGNLVLEAYVTLEMFSLLLQQAQHLRTLQQRYQGSLLPTQDLPEDYLTGLLRFQQSLYQAAKGPLNVLKTIVVASPPLRHLFCRDPPPNTTTTMIGVTSRPGAKQSKAEGQVVWLLRTLWEDDQQLFLMGLSFVVDELERLLQAEPDAASLMTSYTLGVIGDLSIISQCSKQLGLYQPWSRSFENDATTRDDELKKDFSERTKALDYILKSLKTAGMDRVGQVVEPFTRRVNYPSSKRPSRDVVQLLRQAETSLDTVWAKIDAMLDPKTASLNGTALQHLLAGPRTVQRTMEWIEPVPSTKTPVKEQQAAAGPPAISFPGESSERPGKFIAPAQAKAKPKTRGTSSDMPSNDETLQNNVSEVGKQKPESIIAVDAKALKVFRVLFFNPEVTSTPGEVPWTEFVHALVSTGFAAEKLYGSVWQFSPKNLDVERSIHFHEPHPKGKVPFEQARRYGRRLNRAYGWTGDNFILKQKQT